MPITNPDDFKKQQSMWWENRFQRNPPEPPTNSDMIHVLKYWNGAVHLEVILGKNLIVIDLKKYKFINELRKCGTLDKCDLSIAQIDNQNNILTLNQLQMNRVMSITKEGVIYEREA